MVSLKSKGMIESTLQFADAYLLGVKDFSVNMPAYFALKEMTEMIEILKKNKKEVFISLNKNMFSRDLKPLEELLEKIEDLKIDGICFYDVSIPSIVKRKCFTTPLVWNQEHFTTNYLTMNYWYSHNVVYTQLANEITKEEITEIRKNTKMKLIAQVFGYVPIFYSKRPLLTNYIKTFSLQEKKEKYTIEKEGKKYPIKEDKNSFEGYDATILNAYLDLDTLDVDYIFLNSFGIEEEKFARVLRCYKEKDKNNLEKLYPFYSGFFDKKTVYRVRDL